MATLNIWNKLSFIRTSGDEITARHGDPASGSASIPHPITIDGEADLQPFIIGDDESRTLWDDDEDNPTGFLYLYIVCDEDLDLQLVGTTQNVQIPIKANVPFVLASDQILSAANTTDISGTSAISYESIDHIRIRNLSGEDAEGVFGVFN